MEFVVFVFCMSIIALINAAPTPESELLIPHHNNEFELPAIARAGFELIIDITVDEKYHHMLNKMKVILLPNEDKNPEDKKLVSQYCAGDNSITDHTHICIVPNLIQNRNGVHNSTAIQIVRILATLNREEDGLQMMGFLNGNHWSVTSLPLDKFEELKHFSVGGIAGDIKRLQFDFTEKHLTNGVGR